MRRSIRADLALLGVAFVWGSTFPVVKGALADAVEQPFVASLTLNAPDSRLTIKDGKLTLDGKLVTSREESDELEDAELEEAEEFMDETQADGKARISILSIRQIARPDPPGDELINIAPLAFAIRSYPSIGQSIRNSVDGDLGTESSFRGGVRRGGTYEFDFQDPVTVSQFRFHHPSCIHELLLHPFHPKRCLIGVPGHRYCHQAR